MRISASRMDYLRREFIKDALYKNNWQPLDPKERRRIAAIFDCSRSAVYTAMCLILDPNHPTYPKRKIKIGILDRDGWICQYCGRHLPNELRKSVMEHVVPESLGGPLEGYNLVAACFPCNVKKGKEGLGRCTWIPRNFAILQSLNPEWAAKIERLATRDFRLPDDEEE